MSNEYTEDLLNNGLTEEEQELLQENLNNLNLDDLDELNDLDDLDEDSSFSETESLFDDSSDSVFDEFFGDSNLFETEDKSNLDNMLQIDETSSTDETNNGSDTTGIWHDYMQDEKLFSNPDEVLQNAIDYTEKDFENVTDDIIIISGVTESFEVKALKAIADKPRNKEFGSSCFISFNDSLIEIGKMEICLDTFLHLLDLWNYDMYILSKTDEGRVQTKVDLDFLGLLLV